MLGPFADDYTSDEILSIFLTLRDKIVTHPEAMNSGLGAQPTDADVSSIFEKIRKKDYISATEFSLPCYVKALSTLGDLDKLQKVIKDTEQRVVTDKLNIEHLKHLGQSEVAKRILRSMPEREKNLKLLVEFKEQVQLEQQKKETYHPLKDHRRRSSSQGQQPADTSPIIVPKKTPKK